ncbi:MAG: DUF4328 domain-containing protein [Luteolibacter sp.]
MTEPPENPYAAPTSVDTPEPVAIATGWEELKDPRTFGWLAIGFIWLFLLSRMWFIAFTLRMGDLYATDPETPQVAQGVMILMFLATIVTFLMWTYRCAVNARRLEYNRMNTAPWLAVVSYFIPIYHLFGPCLALREVVSITYRHTNRRSVKGLLLHWWLGWIGCNISSQIVTNTELWWFPTTCLAISAIFLTIIIARLSTAQSEMTVPREQPEAGSSRLRHSPLPGIPAGLPDRNLPRHEPHSIPAPRQENHGQPIRPVPREIRPKRPGTQDQTPPP